MEQVRHHLSLHFHTFRTLIWLSGVIIVVILLSVMIYSINGTHGFKLAHLKLSLFPPAYCIEGDTGRERGICGVQVEEVRLAA